MQIHDETFSIQINQHGVRKLIHELEAEIMETIWTADQPTVMVMDVYRMLRQERDVSRWAVMGAMSKLVEKGLLRIVDTVGVANCYAPTCTRATLIDATVDHILGVLSQEFPNEFIKSAGVCLYGIKEFR
jgi:predicted transcriptional regulator